MLHGLWERANKTMTSEPMRMTENDWRELEAIADQMFAPRAAEKAPDPKAANHQGRFGSPHPVRDLRQQQLADYAAQQAALQQQGTPFEQAMAMANYAQQLQWTKTSDGCSASVQEPPSVFATKKPSLDLYVERGPVFVRSLGGTEVYRFESADELDALLKRRGTTKDELLAMTEERNDLRDRVRILEKSAQLTEKELAERGFERDLARDSGQRAEANSILRLLK